ncbi:MAG: ribonuclease HII [Elusimicrobia bacterium]|nr:ribonuclease HII [Elusimicrobiota bacterium]
MQPAKFTLGVDEAGRGSLMGPMVLSGFFLRDREELERLKALGVDDSKKLSPGERERIYEAMNGFSYQSVVFTPKDIDRENINRLELLGVRDLTQRFKPQILIWDAPVPPEGIPKLLCHLRFVVGWTEEAPSPHIILENKADATYVACMAASIVAKVTRDREIARLRQTLGDFGSGYPSDPKTRAFIANVNGGWEAIAPHVRHKWSTLKKISDLKSQASDSQQQTLCAA